MIGVEEVVGVEQLDAAVDPLELILRVHVFSSLWLAEEHSLSMFFTSGVFVLDFDLEPLPCTIAVAWCWVADTGEHVCWLPALSGLLLGLLYHWRS